ncbi:DUF3086 domain-containing protein [Leptolyngbya ohadii]|uniref:DUF3086 domain-containing protein n=1 Tax=Leptolyngbya ohadii TaxID=1962290 RepID=UPI000B59B2B6|nr:DUF3086 domain-containing protein [Leptolyngbya ohadii]
MNSDSSFPSESTGRPPIPLNLGDRSIPPSTPSPASSAEVNDLERRVADLRQQEKKLQQEIQSLQTSYNAMLQRQVTEAQTAIGRLVKESLSDLEQRKQALQLSIEQLERRQERIRNEMKTTFAGSSQDLAIRIQGFKDYLVGSLQDLAAAAEQIQLTPPVVEETRQRPAGQPAPSKAAPAEAPQPEAATPQFAERKFQDETKVIRKLLDQYRTMPDYYGPPWQLRRTFEPIHAERVSNWFFTQGGRGAIRSMGSRLQNILIASAVISILNELYGERLRPLILGNSPERLGEWRRGLQDCLGISRGDFGTEEGIVLFEAPEPLVQRADRLVKQKQLPLILVDESEEMISLSLLQFPLWLAFAPDPMNPVAY